MSKDLRDLIKSLVLHLAIVPLAFAALFILFCLVFVAI
jgi:hypothetical protein